MAVFLSSQMDYIYFFYGLAFFVMAMACSGMGRPALSNLPWGLLGIFGVTHGISEWLDLIAFSLGDTTAFAVFRLAVMLVSFVFLAEFGRSSMERTGFRMPGRWLIALLAVVALPGGYHGLAGVNAAARYSLCLTGGLLAAVSLVRASRKSIEGGRWLMMSGLAIGAYSVAAGLVVPKADFLPAAIINHKSFLDLTGVPIQLVRGMLAVGAAFFIAAYYRAELVRGQSMTRLDRVVYTYKPLVAAMVILATGWLLTEGIGRRDQDDYNRLHLSLTRTIASSLSPDHMQGLSSGTGQIDPVSYKALREHLMQVRLENPECVSVEISTLRKGMVVLVADGERDRSPYHREQGHNLRMASASDVRSFKRDDVGLREVLEDMNLSRFIISVPIFSVSGDIVARLNMGFDAAPAVSMVKEDRLAMIVITCVFSLFSISAFIAWYRTKESIAQASDLELAAYVAENEKKLRAITSALGEGVLQLDATGAVVFMNPEAERLLGWKEEELSGRDGHDMLHHFNIDGSPAMREDCPSLKVLEKGITMQTDGELFTRKDGSTFPVSYVTAPVMSRGRVTGAVVAFQDITLRKHAEDVIKASERSYRTLSENLPGMVYRITLGEPNRMQFFNNMVVPMTGFTAEELTGGGICSLEDRIMAEDLPKVLNAVNMSIIDGTPFQVEYRFRHKDGGTRYFHERGRTIMGAAGKASHIDGVILDITDRRRVESELYMFKFIVEGSGEEIYLLNTEGLFEYANEAACRSLGYRMEELKNMKIWQVDPGFGETEFEAHIGELRKKDLPPFETEHVTRDGRRVTKEVKAARLVMDGREYVCGIVRDISDRKVLERQRTDFFSIVTHDLKSPISVIRGYSDLIMGEYQERVPPEVYEFVGSIRKSSDKIMNLVEDYLAVARLESGVMRLDRSVVNMVDVITEAGFSARALASAKAIHVDVEPAGNAEFKADPVYLQRAVMNLVQNAVNYTPQGGTITLRCALETVEGESYATFSVRDSGPGIAPEERDRIFEKYYRSPRTRGVKGSGLGLTIVREVALAHGGMVMLDTAEGAGSTFKILIPA